LKFKERDYLEGDNRRDHEKAAALLTEAIQSTDDALYKTEYQRLKARLLAQNDQYKEASNLYAEAVKTS